MFHVPRTDLTLMDKYFLFMMGLSVAVAIENVIAGGGCPRFVSQETGAQVDAWSPWGVFTCCAFANLYVGWCYWTSTAKQNPTGFEDTDLVHSWRREQEFVS